jgi:hypothetical protein
MPFPGYDPKNNKAGVQKNNDRKNERNIGRRDKFLWTNFCSEQTKQHNDDYYHIGSQHYPFYYSSTKHYNSEFSTKTYN